jgi:ADP-heptose:LPS heptosyltransferase
MKFPTGEQWLYFLNVLVSRFVNSGKDIAAYQPKTILCIKWDEIGDMVTCTHVFSLLKKRFPNARLDVIAKPYSAPLLVGNPNIENLYTDIGKWKKRYDMVVELRGTQRSLWKTFRYFPKVRLDRGTLRLRNRGNQLHETLTNYEIIKPVLGELPFEAPELFPTPENRFRMDEFLSHSGIVNFCVIHAGARRELRRWKDEDFAALAQWLYTEKGLQVVFAGVPDEEKQIEKISSRLQIPYTLFTAGFSLMDLAALLERASLFVGNESGPLQIAEAMKVPLVGLFGPGVPVVFYPQHPRSRVVHHVLDCNPCDQIHCVRPDNPCMHWIRMDEVKKSVEEVLVRP